MRGIPQPENHRPRKVPPHAPLAMGSVDGATKMAAPSTQSPSGRPSEQGRRGRSFSTCRLVANCLPKTFALEYCISTNFRYICENTFRMSNKYWRILLLISVLLVTRPAAAQGTVSLAPSTTIPVLSTYIYLADGTKYKIIDAAGNGRSYIGPFCLAIEKSGSGSSAETKAYLESIEKDGGRILAIEEETGSGTNSQRSTSYTTLFFIRDHLGSIRAVTDAQGHILERNAYYPFGLQTNQKLAFPTITTSLATLYPNSISSLLARRDLYNLHSRINT